MQPVLSQSPPGPAARILLLALGIAGTLLLLAGALARPLFFDEDPFLAAGVLVAGGQVPYRDFPLLGAPLLPLLLGAVFELVGGWYVLSARLTVFVLSVASGAALWAVLGRLGADRSMRTVLVLACLASPFLTSALATVRPEMLGVLLFLLAFHLHLGATAAEGGRAFLLHAAAALLAGLAAEARLTFLFVPLGLLLHALFAPARRLLPVALGLLLASVPIVLLTVLAGADRVRFGLIDFWLDANPAWYRAQGLEAQLEVPERAQTALSWLFVDGNLTLLVLSVALMLLTVARRKSWKRPGQLLVFMAVCAALLGAVQAPTFAVLFAALAPLLACCVAHLDRVTTFLTAPRRKRVLIVVAALPAFQALLDNGPELARAFRGNWAPLAAHGAALSMRAGVPAGGPVATLYPHLVIDANPILPGLASGPLLFRTGGHYGPERLARLGALTSTTFPAAFEADPPAGILVGAFSNLFRAPMDAPLASWADDRPWRLVATDRSGARLWIK